MICVRACMRVYARARATSDNVMRKFTPNGGRHLKLKILSDGYNNI